jgi:hypothetical protein
MAKHIHLEALADRAPVITPTSAGFYKENCMMCLSEQGHFSGVALQVEFESVREPVTVSWEGTVTEQMIRAYGDKNRRTDVGACTIALLLIPEFTEFVAVEQSATGTGIDYYLTSGRTDDELIFNNAAYLEVSGIQAENENNTIEDRIQSKRRRLLRRPNTSLGVTSDLPTYICIVEFSKPQAKVVVS